MDIFHAIILGIVQGVTEFLPISSSGHLVLFPWLFKWEYQGVAFDAALHLGTLLGVLTYFWKSWKDMLVSFRRRHEKDQFNLRLLFFIVIGTVPGALAGIIFEDFIESAFREPYVVAGAMIIFSLVILLSDKLGSKVKDISHINIKSALVIGFFQAFALVPGVSRSGATISAGLFLGLSRQEAAKFSFLLSAPIIFGAGVFTFPSILKEGIGLPFIVGVLSSAISGYFAIKFLFKYLEKRSYFGFALYRIAFGLIILGLIWAK